MQYDKSFKLEALDLSDEIGVRKAAEQLGIPYYTLADCDISASIKVIHIS